MCIHMDLVEAGSSGTVRFIMISTDARKKTRNSRIKSYMLICKIILKPVRVSIEYYFCLFET